MKEVFVIAEIGINHNGSIDVAKKLIDGAAKAGCNAVKFQKRTIDLVYTKEFLESYRESPWGNTQRDQKEGLEFGKSEYDEIDKYCKEKGIEWFASAWDIESQKFLSNYNCNYNKIASAMLTNEAFLIKVADEKKYTFISTGMSSYDEIDRAVNIFKERNCPYELMHTVSTYPMKNSDANLRMINSLRERYLCNVGYSGHEVGRVVSMTAIALGATSLERHITLDRTMYGSDQAASLQIKDLEKLVEDIKTINSCLGNGEKVLSKSELEVRKKMRGY